MLIINIIIKHHNFKSLFINKLHIVEYVRFIVRCILFVNLSRCSCFFLKYKIFFIKSIIMNLKVLAYLNENLWWFKNLEVLSLWQLRYHILQIIVQVTSDDSNDIVFEAGAEHEHEQNDAVGQVGCSYLEYFKEVDHYIGVAA